MLDKTLTPGGFETRLYEGWERSGAFACDAASNAVPFTVMIPPPNVTGSLHMGHALTFTIQDTLVRWRRMQGRDALWQPGTDHAGIATQMVVERLLAAEGKDLRAIGRDAFLDRVWAWKAESGGTITRQLRRLGASLDWQRERFTMDAGLSAAVRETFVTLHRQGLIYRDRRLVNWDPKLQTAISDLEVESREVRGSLWYVRYPVEGEPGRFVTVATTRPETMLGDTAVAVHPEDARFAELVGKRVVLPLTGRAVPVVADAYSDPEKGTGAVKITPAHDFNDFEVGRRHGLAMPSMLDAEAGIWLAEIEAEFRVVDGVADLGFVRGLAGQDRFAARRAIVARLEELGLLEKVEPHVHQVPHGDRGGVPLEPRLTVQWYADAAALAKPAIEAVESGRTEFVPKQWENTFFAWMRDIQPWCISRQLWWGHRIPAWYAPDGTVFVERTELEALAAARARFGQDMALVQDEDVLDTWFSSALWPFSTLGWPERTTALARYYPGDVLVTGFDIIFFWVARMMMMGLHLMGEVPFRTVYIHGLVRDERGQKMSKSKGNAIDPLELVDAYGADALRFAICALTGPGRDVKLGRARVEEYRRFGTKLWNAARFCEANGIASDPAWDPASARNPLALWILDAANGAVAEATAALEAYRFDDYASACYRFVWNTFCDWFIEFSKPVLYGEDGPEKAEVKGVAQHVLGVILRLLHPAMPFMTEELWKHFGYGAEFGLIRVTWPEDASRADEFSAEAQGIISSPLGLFADIHLAIEIVKELRKIRAELNIPNSIKLELMIDVNNDLQVSKTDLQRWLPQVERLAALHETQFVNGLKADKRIEHAAQFSISGTVCALSLLDVVDFEVERNRLSKEKSKIEKEIKKTIEKLEDNDFLNRAPQEIITTNRDRLDKFQNDLTLIDASLERIFRLRENHDA